MAANRDNGSGQSLAPHDLEAALAPMHSAVNWALLGLVIERPGHGYELAGRFEREYRDLLALSGVSYIYRALDALERRGWVDALPDGPARRLPKTRYRVTVRGLGAYQEHLLAQMVDSDRQRRLFFRKLAVLVLRPQLALEIIARYEHACLEQADRRPALAAETQPNDPPSALAARLSAEDRRLAPAATLAWLQYARGELEALAEHDLPDDEPA